MGDTLVAPAAWEPTHQNKFWPRREETDFLAHQRLTEAVLWEELINWEYRNPTTWEGPRHTVDKKGVNARGVHALVNHTLKQSRY